MPVHYECNDCQFKTMGKASGCNIDEPEGWLVLAGEFARLAGSKLNHVVLCPDCQDKRGIVEPLWAWMGPPIKQSHVAKVSPLQALKGQKKKTKKGSAPTLTGVAGQTGPKKKLVDIVEPVIADLGFGQEFGQEASDGQEADL